ncbi:hypothetical protein ACLILY_30715 [Mycobacterium sp. MS3]|uniref:hypothetical protein n=1 Tax=Mycobacterium sp. MS3 TaxID=3391378 RepID=UPI0039895693
MASGIDGDNLAESPTRSQMLTNIATYRRLDHVDGERGSNSSQHRANPVGMPITAAGALGDHHHP